MISYIECLTNAKQNLHFQDKTHMVMIYHIFSILVNVSCYYFMEDVLIYIYEEYWCVVFLCFYCLHLGIRIMLVS